MVSVLSAIPVEVEPVAPPLRQPALPLFLVAAILLAPLLWVAIVLIVASDLHKEACDVA